MPPANHRMITTVEVEGRPFVLKRPIAEYSARRIAASIPALRRLNACKVSFADAACNLGVSVEAVKSWSDLAGIEWHSAKKPYARR